jgi:hypothetical protein
MSRETEEINDDEGMDDLSCEVHFAFFPLPAFYCGLFNRSPYVRDTPLRFREFNWNAAIRAITSWIRVKHAYW